MSLHRETLMYLPSASSCVNVIMEMHRAFKSTFKRNAVVDLFYSMGFSTDTEKLDDPDTHSVTLQVDPAEIKAVEEAAWVRASAQAILSLRAP